MFGNIYDTLYELSKDEWLENIHNKPKLRTYIRFKPNLSLEPYVEYHMQKRQRSLLAQYRFLVTVISPVRLGANALKYVYVFNCMYALVTDINNNIQNTYRMYILTSWSFRRQFIAISGTCWFILIITTAVLSK